MASVLYLSVINRVVLKSQDQKPAIWGNIGCRRSITPEGVVRSLPSSHVHRAGSTKARNALGRPMTLSPVAERFCSSPAPEGRISNHDQVRCQKAQTFLNNGCVRY